jgi:hypothetical protein
MRGAGGTDGGAGHFFIGLIMMAGGGYLFLHNIDVSLGMGFGYRFFGFGGMGITSGMVLIPFLFGIGMIFYNSSNLLGWLLTVLSLAMLAFGVIAQTRLSFRHMSAFDLITILVLLVGGLGLFLRSLRDHSVSEK